MTTKKQDSREKMIQSMFNTVNGKKIAFLGLAFTKSTNDTRESAAICVADHLLEEQAQISLFDWEVQEHQIYKDLNCLNTRSDQDNKELLKVIDNPYQACQDPRGIAILTEWDEFKEYERKRIKDNMKKPAFVFDGRKLLDRKKLEDLGFVYYAIGE